MPTTPTSTAPRDRRAQLEAVGTLNGIDFVEIANDAETRLRVQFLTATPDATSLAAAITGATISGGQSIPTVEVQPAGSWVWAMASNGRPVVDLTVAAPGDFSTYTLSEFSARRYPAWQERSEADFGVMFMEALASLADDLSYQQDRIAAEAWLETATERRSLVQLARLV